MKQDSIVPNIVFEATEVYSKALKRFMQACGFEDTLMNPLEAKIQSLALRRHEAGRSDAHKLAQACFTQLPRHKTVQDIYYEEMRSLSRHYTELEQEIVRLRTRMHALVQMTFPELEHLFTRVSDLYLSILQLFPHLDQVTDLSRIKVKNQILTSNGKRQSRKHAEEKADSMIRAAADAYPALAVHDVRVDQLRNYAAYIQILMEK